MEVTQLIFIYNQQRSNLTERKKGLRHKTRIVFEIHPRHKCSYSILTDFLLFVDLLIVLRPPLLKMVSVYISLVNPSTPDLFIDDAIYSLKCRSGKRFQYS